MIRGVEYDCPVCGETVAPDDDDLVADHLRGEHPEQYGQPRPGGGV